MQIDLTSNEVHLLKICCMFTIEESDNGKLKIDVAAMVARLLELEKQAPAKLVVIDRKREKVFELVKSAVAEMPDEFVTGDVCDHLMRCGYPRHRLSIFSALHRMPDLEVIQPALRGEMTKYRKKPSALPAIQG